MQPHIAFGVGCFHFAVKQPPDRFRPADYVETVEGLLRNLDTVDRFSVSPLSLPDRDDWDLPEDALSMLTPHGCAVPNFMHAVEFSLRIPGRVQKDLIGTIRGDDYPWIGLGTEHFMVRTRYFFHGPVTFIECLDLDDREHEDPSDAVIVVREYLRQKLGECGANVALEVIGPSPFHANFFVFDATDSDRPRVEHVERRSYNVINLHIPQQAPEIRPEWLLDWMGDHLSFYYDLKRLDRERIMQWSRIEVARRGLNDSSGVNRRLGKIGAFIRRRRAITNLVENVLMFRAEMLSDRQRTFIDNKKIQAVDENLKFLDRKLDDTLEDSFGFDRYPTSELLELAKFYEDRDAKWRDRMYFVLAATMGGTIGAILSQLFRGS